MSSSGFPRLYRFETVRLAMSNTRERSIGGPHDRSLVSTSLYSAIVDGIRSWGPMAALVILCLSFGLADPSFATFENLQTIASRAAIPVIIAVGMTFIIIQGSIDLSIEGVMAAASLTFAMSVLNTRTKLDLGFAGVLLGRHCWDWFWLCKRPDRDALSRAVFHGDARNLVGQHGSRHASFRRSASPDP